MKVCASKSCAARAVSLRDAVNQGWRYLRGQLFCARCYSQEAET